VVVSRAIVFEETGDPEVLKTVQIEVGEPGPGEVRIRNTAIGVNFSDVYTRAYNYRKIPLPGRLGYEGAGVIDAVGPGVTKFRVGDRVAYGVDAYGAYADCHVHSASKTHAIPEGVSDAEAAAVISKAITVYSLIKRVYPVRADDTVLLHSAAGGIGLIACQWLKHNGATVIATASTPAKMELALDNGADHAIRYGQEDIAGRVSEITGGKLVDAVFDGVGAPTFEASLNSLKVRGFLVSFGQASGEPISEREVATLLARNSIYFVKPAAKQFFTSDEDLDAAVAEIFELVRSGVIRARIHQQYPLEDVARCHADLESRKTMGSCILIP
jgi:NADPH2:quinone reductase